jgi:hypothetical protein
MPLTLKLYQCTDERKKINKNINDENVAKTINNVTPYEALSDLEGYVIIDYDADVFDLNYAKLENSYYFITDRERLIGNKMKLYLKMDALFTYKTDVLRCPAIAERSNVGNPYIIDPELPLNGYKLYRTFGFKKTPGSTYGSFNYNTGSGGTQIWNPQYILVTVG